MIVWNVSVSVKKEWLIFLVTEKKQIARISKKLIHQITTRKSEIISRQLERIERMRMRTETVCGKCRSKQIDYLGKDRCYCHRCGSEQESRDETIESPYERTRRAVYATGNRWAIENFNAIHSL